MNAYDAIEYPYGFGVDKQDSRVPDLGEPIELAPPAVCGESYVMQPVMMCAAADGVRIVSTSSRPQMM